MRIRTCAYAVSLTAALVVLGGCCRPDRSAMDGAPAFEMRELSAAYRASTARRQDPHPSLRLPHRLARARALRHLTQECDGILATLSPAEIDQRISTVPEETKGRLRESLNRFRVDVERLRVAASRSNPAATRRMYASTLDSFRRVEELSGESG